MDTGNIDFIDGGTVTSPEGFFAGATCSGIKKDKKSFDLGILCSEALCVTTGIFTTSNIKSAPVELCQEKLKEGRAQAVVANSGCSNAYTGEQGMADAAAMANMTVPVISERVAPQKISPAVTSSTFRGVAMIASYVF